LTLANRHGHYDEYAETDELRKLTALGRQQAKIMGAYISQMPWRPTRLIVSDMTRARQTFEILLDALPKDVAPITILPSLRECRPCQVTIPCRSHLVFNTRSWQQCILTIGMHLEREWQGCRMCREI
jgi:hypothetical protein